MERLLAIGLLATSSFAWGQFGSLTQTVDELLKGSERLLGPEAAILTRSGDAAARAIRAHHDVGKLNPQEIRIALYILTSAFDLPENIAETEDRDPRSTMSVLEELKSDASSTEEKKRIEKAAQEIAASLDQFRATVKESTMPRCRVFFEVSSATAQLKFVHIHTAGATETHQTDEQGKARLTLLAGQSETYHFTAPRFRSTAITLSCLGNEYISREVVLVGE